MLRGVGGKDPVMVYGSNVYYYQGMKDCSQDKLLGDHSWLRNQLGMIRVKGKGIYESIGFGD